MAHDSHIDAAQRRHGERVKTRRDFLIAGGVGLCLLAEPPVPFAQTTGRTRRIGFLGTGSAAGMADWVGALSGGLRELGYVEGQNLAIEYRWADGKYERAPELAAELVRLKVEVLVTHGTPGTRAAKGATATIPIVMATAGDAVLSGLVASLARPAGTREPRLIRAAAKRLELVRETLPRVTKVALPSVPAIPAWSGPPSHGAAAKSRSWSCSRSRCAAPADFEGL